MNYIDYVINCENRGWDPSRGLLGICPKCMLEGELCKVNGVTICFTCFEGLLNMIKMDERK